MGVHRKFTEAQLLEIRNLFEIQSLSVVELSKKFGTTKDNIRGILKGERYDGIGLSQKYIKENASRIITDETKLQIIEDYKNGVPLPDILKKYDISREHLRYYRNKFKIQERNAKRAVTLKSITLEYKGSVKTYSSIEAASKETGIIQDFLFKLKRGKTFTEGKYAKEQVVLVHDLIRLEELEQACELMGKILSSGTTSDKFKWGKELKTLLYNLGYANEEQVELSNKH